MFEKRRHVITRSAARTYGRKRSKKKNRNVFKRNCEKTFVWSSRCVRLSRFVVHRLHLQRQPEIQLVPQVWRRGQSHRFGEIIYETQTKYEIRYYKYKNDIYLYTYIIN